LRDRADAVKSMAESGLLQDMVEKS
jgi:hypothetical protein